MLDFAQQAREKKRKENREPAKRGEKKRPQASGEGTGGNCPKEYLLLLKVPRRKTAKKSKGERTTEGMVVLQRGRRKTAKERKGIKNLPKRQYGEEEFREARKGESGERNRFPPPKKKPIPIIGVSIHRKYGSRFSGKRLHSRGRSAIGKKICDEARLILRGENRRLPPFDFHPTAGKGAIAAFKRQRRGSPKKWRKITG